MSRLSEVKLKVLTVVTLSSVLATAGLSLVKAVDSKDVTFVTEKSSGDTGVNREINTDKEITSNVLKDSNQKENTVVPPEVEIRGGRLASTEGNPSVSNESSSIMFKEVEKGSEVGESQGDFSVSLVNVPADGYGYDLKDRAKASIRINNTTGKDLSNLVVKFKVKKKLIDDYSSDFDGVKVTDVFEIGDSLLQEYSRELFRFSAGMGVISKSDPYLSYKLFMNTVTAGKRIDTTVDLWISLFKFRTKGIYIPSSDYLSNRDFDIEYEILDGSNVLGSGVLPIHTKAPDLVTAQRKFMLDLTRTGRSGEPLGQTFNSFTNGGTARNVFTMVDDRDNKFWLVVKDKDKQVGLYQYIENSKFKFKIPRGFILDEDLLKQYYPGMKYTKENDTVEVDVRPGDVGLTVGNSGGRVERGFKFINPGDPNTYFALPLIKNDERVDTYNFSVDTSNGAFPEVTGLTLDDKQTFIRKSELDLIKGNAEYTGAIRPDANYIYDNDYLNLPSGHTYNVTSLEYDTKVNGANMKALVFNPNFFQNTKIYGLRSDGSRVVLDAQSFKTDDYILGEYFKTKVRLDKDQSVVHIPNDIVKLRFEFDRTIKNGDYFDNIPVWEVLDENAVKMNKGHFRLGVNGAVKEYPYIFYISNAVQYRNSWNLNNLDFRNKLTTLQYFSGYDGFRYDLISVDTSHLRKHVIVKVPKDFSMEFNSRNSEILSSYDIVGEEVHGDTKYILISQKEGVPFITPSLYTLVNMSPTVLDGVYNISSRVYLEGRGSLPNWLTIKPIKEGGQEYSFQYDPTRSIRDNYEMVTDGTEARAKITVEKPKVLSTTTTVNDVTNLKVKSFDTIFNVKSYVTNNSSDPVSHPVLDVVIPDKLELAKAVVVPSGYKVQYQLDGSNDYVDNVSDFSKVRKYRVVANDSNSSILPNTNLIVEAPMKLKRGITSDVNEAIKTTVTHGGGTLISDVVKVTSDLQEFKDGVINVKWVDDKGVTLKTQKLTGRHGTKYVVDRAMFTKDGKYYKYVSVEGTPEGTYTGGVTSDVVVHMKEQEITFELPMTGTIGTLGVLGSLLSALGVTFARKRGR